MPKKNLSSANRTSILFYLFLLTFFFILLEISFFIQCNQAYLADFTTIAGHVQIPITILPGILFFVGAQLLVHVGFVLLVWFCVVYGRYVVKLSEPQQFNCAILLWLMGLTAVLAANQYYFPNSKFAALSSLILLTPLSAKWVAIFLSSLFLIAVLIAIIGLLVRLANTPRLGLTFLVLSLLGWVSVSQYTASVPIIRHAQPNIFIIGIDSLRPDYLSYFGAKQRTPFLDSVLNQATVFSQAMTPLARTFPSWVSILTGEHPHQSGVRSNLINLDQVNVSNALPALFKQQGYHTIYATDETRFSNIDERFGFERIITPPMGLNDFLLGTFNDFPLSNLLINTRVGRWLFPHSYANRPAFITYDPDSFLNLMQPALLKTQEKPLFMAVHFCLPHHPYVWASLPADNYSGEARYQASIARVDQQIQSFFMLLEKSHLLDHAVVVLLSDHGEALELAGDRITERRKFIGRLNEAGQPPRFYPPSLADEAVNQSAGHGTDVLGLTQYRTLLAFKFFGYGKQVKGKLEDAMLLTDIKPTLLSLAGLSSSPYHIAARIRGERATPLPQPLFLESDYSPESLRTVYPEARQVLLEGLQLYQINPHTTRITLKDGMAQMIIRSKQYATIYGDWMLALYPQPDSHYLPILINLTTGFWTNDLQSSFAQHSPARLMHQQLQDFYAINMTH